MADFAADFYASQGWVSGTIDPIDFAAVFAPRLSDLTPPTIDQVSPDPSSGPVPKTQAFTFRMRDDLGFSLNEIMVRFGDAVAFDWVCDMSASPTERFKGKYADSSITPVTGGWQFAIVREGGWPAGKRVRLRFYVVDVGGNLVVIDA